MNIFHNSRHLCDMYPWGQLTRHCKWRSKAINSKQAVRLVITLCRTVACSPSTWFDLYMDIRNRSINAIQVWKWIVPVLFHESSWCIKGYEGYKRLFGNYCCVIVWIFIIMNQLLQSLWIASGANWVCHLFSATKPLPELMLIFIVN